MTTLARLAPPTSVAIGDDDGSASSVTDASFDVSVQHETTRCKEVAAQRKPNVAKASPQPILLRFPSSNSKPLAIPLGVEASLSLPLISYIYPTSPLARILSVGDVILEIDGRRSTDLSYADMNRWFAGGSLSDALGRKETSVVAGSEDTSGAKNGSADGEERTLLFLPGRNSPYNPENTNYTGPINLKSLQNNELQDIDDEPTSSCLNEKLSRSITILDGPLLRRASSRDTDGYDRTRQVFSRKSSDVHNQETETGVQPKEEEIHDVHELQYKPVRVDSLTSRESASQVLVLSDDCSMKSRCTLYLDEDASKGPNASSPQDEVDSSSAATPSQLQVKKVMMDDEPVEGSAETSSVATPVYSLSTKKEEDVPVSPSTTATTYSKSSDGSSSKGLISVEEELLDSILLPPFSLQHVSESTDVQASPTPEESKCITYDPSPIMVFARLSPSTISSSEDLSRDTFSSSIKELIALSISDGSQDSTDQIETSVKDVADEITSLEQQVTEDVVCAPNNSVQLDSSASAEDLLQQKDLQDQQTNAAQDQVLPSEDALTSPLGNDYKNQTEGPNETGEDLNQQEELITPDVSPQTIQEPTTSDDEEVRNWEQILLRQERIRPAPAFNEITVNLGDCREDISTIYGGKYNPSQHSTLVRIEDNLIGYMESGQYHPNHPAIYDYNTSSQMKLHQQDSQARKLALEEQDFEMKQAKLLRLKKQHCVIEGIFAVFISVAVIVLIGIVVAVMRGGA